MRLGVLLCLLLVHLTSAPAAARQSPQRLTVEDARRIARTQSAAAQRARNGHTLAVLRERQAFNSTFIPNFSSGLSFSTSRFRRYTAEDFVGQPLDRPYYAQAVSSSTSQSVGTSMELFSGGKLLELRSARAALTQARTTLDVELQRAAAEAERGFYRALIAQDAVLLEERFTNSARERFAAEKQRLAAGMALPVDVLGAEIEVLDQESRLEQVRGDALKARLQLLDVLGITSDTHFELVGEVPEAFDPSGLDADALAAQALRSSPRAILGELELESSEMQRRRARTFRWPAVRASAGYARTRGAEGTDALFELMPKNWGYDMSLQVSVPVPILRFNENLGVAAADLAHARAAEQNALDRAALERQVRAGVLDLNSSYRNLQSAQRRAELSTERARLAREGHRHGTVSFLDLQQYVDRDAQAQRALLDARVAFVTSLLSLEELLGTGVPR